jgi:DNA-directed RNA polymerase specialized sigma24 family protein
MMRTPFEAYWYGLSREARDAWIKRNIWALARTLEETYWSRALLEGADDIVIHTLKRLLWDPTGEYAPRGESRPEDYFRRCLWIRIKAVARMARADKRRFVGPNHVALDELVAGVALDADTPETLLTEREAMQEAKETVARVVANSRLRGVTRKYAENFVHFAAEGLGTAEIARRFNTNEANVRSARRRLLHVLVRAGVIGAGAAGEKAGETDAEQEAVGAPLVRRTRTERRH